MVNTKPTHYSRWKIQPIEFIRANSLDFARANIIKYIMRFDDKDGLKDLEKAKQYLEWLIEDNYGLDVGPFEIPDGSITPTASPFLNSLTGYKHDDLILAERILYENV